MFKLKYLNVIVSIFVAVSMLLGAGAQVRVSAKVDNAPMAVDGTGPANATDETKVPHYFGPNANWANSPMTIGDAGVVIAAPPAGGTQATAAASVGANGAITGITITNPGSGYTAAPLLTFTGPAGFVAPAATVSFNTGGSVVAVNVTPGFGGAGYTTPVVTITGGTTDATATAFGGVDAVALTSNGLGYTMPVVDFDMPDDPNGVQAKGHAVMAADGSITSVVVDSAGSGYSKAPGVVVRDGPVFAPVNNRVANRAASARAQVIAGGVVSPNAIAAAPDAVATATLTIQTVVVNTFGAGYTGAASVSFADTAPGTGAGAAATAVTDFGAITGITVDPASAGSGFTTTGGIQKFKDGLPSLCIPGTVTTATFADCVSNNLGQHIPIAVADTTTFTVANGFAADADYYVIALVQHREQMSSSLPAKGSLMREYVQLLTPANAAIAKNGGVPLMNDMLTGPSVPALMPNGSQAIAVDDPHYLGPIIVATKDKPVRIVFYNLLPNNGDGDLFLPVDSSMMGSGMGPMAMMDPVDAGLVTDAVRNPMCTNMKDANCFKDDRATLHLHGGTSPWISDGTAHQWITPANETTPWPQGVGVESVPDMITSAALALGVPNCDTGTDGCMSFYYTNQQSARMLFYHDHAWGITRLNVYAGEAAGYVITDPTDQKLFGVGGQFSDLGVGTPLVIQDRTFVPQDTQLYNVTDTNGKVISYGQDPTWDKSRWGDYGDLWYHHVYMPAQNPGDPSGMSAYGRWMYGPWFWPPAGTAKYQPIANPYYDPACNLDVPATWQYDVDPFCEPQLIPGTPNISVGMEQFNDTPLVNGTAYPTTTVDPKAYRFRMLNAANDRFWNLQWYIADPRSASTAMNGDLVNPAPIGGTEVALNPAEVAAAQLDPVIFPTPLKSIVIPNAIPTLPGTTVNLEGPDWVQIGSEGGFLPAPVVVDGQQVTTWITDPTRFDVGNVDLHSLVLAPAERADVIVDFSQFAGQTLILYNDAPAAYPARVPSYDYYTGAPQGTLPGYGPNTRTVMQVKVSLLQSDGSAPATAFDVPNTSTDRLGTLQNAFKHHSDPITHQPAGVFETGQHPIIVGQAAYNTAYGTSFAAASWCNAPGSTQTSCDGFARISDQGRDLFGFNTLKAPTTKMQIPLEPKAIHDEMNSASFDEFGRMTANLGLEVVPANPAAQNIVLYPFVNPATELIDGTNLPSADTKVAPISSAADGTQIWKITHNGVDTHPIHFHLFDVQVLNRVTWDNIIIPTEPTELGWKDTVRISPLEDTYVALRPVIPAVPFEVPNSVRALNPMMPLNDTSMFNPVDPNGDPTANILNQLVNFGWEYVFHCHILSHEEMDMMRPMSLVLPPLAPSGLTYAISGTGNNTRLTLTFNDNSITETSFVAQKSTDGIIWADVATLVSPLDQPNTHGTRSIVVTPFNRKDPVASYRVVAKNTIGLTTMVDAATGNTVFPTKTAQSISASILAIPNPSNLTATLQAGPQIRLAWVDNTTNETGFVIEKSTDGVNFTPIVPNRAANVVTYTDTAVAVGNSYTYRVAAVTTAGNSGYTNTVTVSVFPPAAPTNLNATILRIGPNFRLMLTWTDNANNETGYTVSWSKDPNFVTGVTTRTLGTNATTTTTPNIATGIWYFRVQAINPIVGPSGWVTSGQITVATVNSPLVFLSTFIFGPAGWTGQSGNVAGSPAAAIGDDGDQGLVADMAVDDDVLTPATGPAYVFHTLPAPLGSYMATFSFDPNGADPAGTPVDIFTGHNADGIAIFGVQFQLSGAQYQVRAWALADGAVMYTAWNNVADNAKNIQLDWQSSQAASLNLYVNNVLVSSVIGDTSPYMLSEERLGPGSEMSVSPSAVGAVAPSGTVYFDTFFSLSTQASPFTPLAVKTIFLPLVNR